MRESFVALALASFMMNILALAVPLTLLQMYDRVIPNKSFSTLTLLGFGVVTAILLEVLLRSLRGYVMGWLGARFEHRVSVAGLKHLMGTKFRDFTHDEVGVHSERLRSANHVKRFASGQALIVFMDLPFVIIFLSVIGFIAGWLGLVVLALLIVFIALSIISGRSLRARTEGRIVHDDRRFNFLSETFHGIHSVKTMAMEPMMHRRYERLQEANVEMGADVTHGSTVASSMGAMFTQIMIVSVVSAGSYIIVQGGMTPGSLAACIMLSVRSLSPLRSSLSVWMRYQNYKISRRRIRRLFRLPSFDTSDLTVPQNIQGKLELKGVNVHFAQTESPLLKNLNLLVSPGECISIVGDSGSGKTSLLSILNGTLEPDSGDVLIDDVPVGSIEPKALHASVAYLPQRGALVSGTILENITMFDKSLTDAAIKASEAVGLDRVVAGMRMGYETLVGGGAVETIPAGIRQRVAIARAIVNDPSVILFDEANLSIDGGGDVFLRKYLESMKGKCTIILVTVRPSLLRLSDRVYKLHDGHLEEADLDSLDLWGKDPKEDVERELLPPDARELELSDALNDFPKTSDLSLCLPPLLNALKWQGSPRILAEALPHLVDSLDLTGFRGAMANLAFRSNSYQTRFKDVDNRLLPCLFVPETSGAKVILRADGNENFTYYDSETDSQHTGKPPSERGEAIVFSKPGQLELMTGADQGSWTSRIFRRFKGFIAFVMALTVVSTILSLATPLFIMASFALVLPTSDLSVLGYLVIGVVIALVLDWKMRALKSRVLSFMAGRSEYIIGNSIFQRVIGLPAQSIERVPVAEQVARIKDLEALRDFFLGPLSLLMYELPATLIYIIVLGIINPWIIVIVLISAASYALLGAMTFRAQARKTTASTRLLARRNEFLTETLENMLTIRRSGAEECWIDRYRNLSGEAVIADLQAHRFSDWVSSIAQFISLATGLAAMIFTVTAAINGDIHPGAVIATMIIIWRVTGPLQNTFMASTTLVRVFNSLRQIDNLMRLKGERDDSKSQTTRPRVRGDVAFSRVSFRYSMNADPALLGVTFSAKAGEIIALAGPNGSGKSTILKLLVHVYHPQAGSIRLDSVDIRQIPPEELRKQVSYMPQHCEVFYGTIAQNLRLSHPTASDDDLYWAANMAGLLDDILAMEQGSGQWRRTGFDVRIGDASSEQLPNGFRQRLAICRTLLRQTPVLLLDEPGSGLDAEGDRALIKALEQIRGKSTIFLATHRPSHLRLADQVIYLEQGAIQAKGPFESIKETIMAGL